MLKCKDEIIKPIVIPVVDKRQSESFHTYFLQKKERRERERGRRRKVIVRVGYDGPMRALAVCLVIRFYSLDSREKLVEVSWAKYHY